MSEIVQIPATVQNRQATWYTGTIYDNNVLHLFQGNPALGMGVTLAAFDAAEVSGASWYTPQAITFGDAINDLDVADQLDVVVDDVVFRFNDGSGDDSPVTVTGYYLVGATSQLTGYASLGTPVTLAAVNDGLVCEPLIELPPQAS
jgi:hypothetical protein